MSSKATTKSQTGTIAICRIGERVFLSPLTAEDPDTGEIASNAIRRMEIAAGKKPFLLHQMAADFELDAIHALPDLHSFMNGAALSPAERIELLKALFGVAVPMFRLRADPLLLTLARSIADTPGLPRAVIGVDVIDGYDTAIATIPSKAGVRAQDVLVQLSGDQLQLTLGRVQSVHNFLARENPRQQLAAVYFSGDPVDGDYLLIGAAGLVRVETRVRHYEHAEAFYAEHGYNNPDLPQLYAQADEEAAIALNRLARRSPPSSVIHEPLLGLQMMLDSAIPLADGFFASGWFYDPDQLIDSLTAVDHSLENPQISSIWKLFDARADLLGKTRAVKGFVSFLPARRSGPPPAQVPVHVLLRNGDNHVMVAAPAPHDLLGQRERILEAIATHALTPDMLEHVFAPALAPIQQELNARQAVRSIREFGPRSSREVSLIIPLYRETGFIHSQLMAFAVDPYIGGNCEILYVLDDPLIALEVAGMIEGSTFAFSLDIKLVTLDRNGGYALANNMGVAEADGETIVLMNSDIIPDRAGWLQQALEKLELLPPFSVIGPKLLYADDGLQHAGMFFHQLSTGYWQNLHYWKGYGRHFPPANVERTVPAVTGACMILRKEDYLAVGGFTTDYIIGDYEDSDLCLKLRDRQGVAFYMPSIELYHFERQSMPVEADDRDFGSTSYNRALHTLKWSKQIPIANAVVLDTAHAE